MYGSPLIIIFKKSLKKHSEYLSHGNGDYSSAILTIIIVTLVFKHKTNSNIVWVSTRKIFSVDFKCHAVTSIVFADSYHFLTDIV